MSTQAERIKELRKHFKMSQEEFGGKIALTKGHISQLEAGKSPLSNKAEKMILREFNVNPTWLKKGEGNMFLEVNNKDDTAMLIAEALKISEDDYKKRILKALCKIPAEDWETVIKVIEMFIDEWTK